MPTTRKRVYLDTSVYLAVFLGEANREGAQAAIADAEQGETQVFLSGLVMAESVGHPSLRSPQGSPQPSWQSRLDAVIDYFRRTSSTYVEESQRAGERAMDLAVQFGLKGPDALHLALAEAAGCEEFFTFDDKQLRTDGFLSAMRVLHPYGSPQTEFAYADPDG